MESDLFRVSLEMNRVEKSQKKEGGKIAPFKLDRGNLLYFYHPDILQAVVGLGHYHICDNGHIRRLQAAVR